MPTEFNNALFESFDSATTKRFAHDNPDTFLEKNKEYHSIIIDEAQIKESLTGRMSRIRLFPFTLAETLQLPFDPNQLKDGRKKLPRCNRSELFRYLKNGGMPGVFALRSQDAKETFFEDWISLITNRDILFFQKLKPNSELTDSLIRLIPKIETPDATHLAKALHINTKMVQKHLLMLEQLFVIHKIPPHRLSTGKPRYYVLDPAMAGYLGASLDRQLQTWPVLEMLANASYGDSRKAKPSYYRSARNGIIEIIHEKESTIELIKLLFREKIDLRELEILHAFSKKNSTRFYRKQFYRKHQAQSSRSGFKS